MIEQYILKQRQSLPLEAKVSMSLAKIRQWYENYRGDVYVSFSGGKDSTVLLDLVRHYYPHVPAVFVNTGLEYPEIVSFVNTIDNANCILPKQSFRVVVDKYGFPMISKIVSRKISDIQNPTENNVASRNLYLTGVKKDGSKSKHCKLAKRWLELANSDVRCSHKCCDVLKKEPLKRYHKETGLFPYIGTMADESRTRELSYLQTGCNAFDSVNKVSMPLAFWKEEDIWEYIKTRNLPYSDIYKDRIVDGVDVAGEKRTGCMFCMFGIMFDGVPNRFQRMAISHPKQWNYCINKLGLKKCLEKINIPYNKIKSQLQFEL